MSEQMQKFQMPVALVCVLAMAASMMGLVYIPEIGLTALALIAGALGIKRPSEVAAQLAADLHKSVADDAIERLKTIEAQVKDEGP